jgi:hypothetical protein
MSAKPYPEWAMTRRGEALLGQPRTTSTRSDAPEPLLNVSVREINRQPYNVGASDWLPTRHTVLLSLTRDAVDRETHDRDAVQRALDPATN